MSTVLDVRHQLCELCERVGVDLTTGGSECGLSVRKALLTGLGMNAAQHAGEGKYLTVST